MLHVTESYYLGDHLIWKKSQTKTSKKQNQTKKHLTCKSLGPVRLWLVLPFLFSVALHCIPTHLNPRAANKRLFLSSNLLQRNLRRPTHHIGVFVDYFQCKYPEICLVNKLTRQVRFFSPQPLFSAPACLHSDRVRHSECPSRGVYCNFQREKVTEGAVIISTELPKLFCLLSM